jgi:O-antigen/teichoic acid export membrane protein
MSTKQSLQEKIVKGSIITLVISLLGSVFAYLTRVLYSRTLSIDDYGLFYAVLSIFLMFTTYLDLGFGYSSVYLLPKYLKIKDFAKAWNIFIYGQATSLIMSVIISIILSLSAPFLAKEYLKVPGSEILIYIFCIFLISFSIINGMIQVYSGLQKEKYYSSITLFRWLFTFVISLLFLLAGFSNIVFFAIAWSVGHLLTGMIFIFMLYFRHSFLTANRISWEKDTFKQMFSLAIPSIAETFISSVFLMTVTFFLTYFKGVTDVGLYNIILPLASIPTVLLSPLNTLLLPLVSHLSEGERDKLRYLTEKILSIIPYIGVYFALFIVMFPSASVGLIFGEKWLGRVEDPLAILSLGTISLLMLGILGVIVLGLGKAKERLKIAVIVAVTGVPLNALFIWYFGIMGAVITTTLVSLVLNFLFLRMIKRDLSIKVPYLFYIKISLFSIGLFILARIFKISPNGWFQFISYGIIYTLIYAGLGYLLKIYDNKLMLMLVRKES